MEIRSVPKGKIYKHRITVVSQRPPETYMCPNYICVHVPYR